LLQAKAIPKMADIMGLSPHKKAQFIKIAEGESVLLCLLVSRSCKLTSA
jgi:hypothetical protein